MEGHCLEADTALKLVSKADKRAAREELGRSINHSNISFPDEWDIMIEKTLRNMDQWKEQLVSFVWSYIYFYGYCVVRVWNLGPLVYNKQIKLSSLTSCHIPFYFNYSLFLWKMSRVLKITKGFVHIPVLQSVCQLSMSYVARVRYSIV